MESVESPSTSCGLKLQTIKCPNSVQSLQDHCQSKSRNIGYCFLLFWRTSVENSESCVQVMHTRGFTLMFADCTHNSFPDSDNYSNPSRKSLSKRYRALQTKPLGSSLWWVSCSDLPGSFKTLVEQT